MENTEKTWSELVQEHVENILPGFVITVLVLAHFPCLNAKLSGLLQHSFISSATFVSVSYLLGVLAWIIARLTVHGPAYLTLPAFLKVFDPDKFRKKSWRRCWIIFRATTKNAVANPDANLKARVLKRRERGRLTRTALVPVVLTVWLLVSPWWGRILWCFGLWLGFVLLFSYAFVCYFQEAANYGELIDPQSGEPTS